MDNIELDDDRIRWIRQRVSFALDINPLIFDNYFHLHLEKIQEFYSFLSNNYLSGSSLFFSSIVYIEDIAIEVENDTDTSIIQSNEEALEIEIPNEEPENEVKPHKPNLTLNTELDQDNNIQNAIKPIESTREKSIKIQKSERVELLMSINLMSSEMHDRSTVVFIRSTDGDIPHISENDDLTILNTYFEFTVLSGDLLQGIANLVNQVYVPVVNSTSKYSYNIEVTNDIDVKDKIDESLRNELNSNITVFEQQLRNAAKQSRGDSRFAIPNLYNHTKETIHTDLNLINELKYVLDDWINLVWNAIESEIHSARKSSTPIGEIEYWRDRQFNLSSLYEQMSSPKITSILEIMSSLQFPQLNTFHYHFNELTKLYLEAKDNVKFLTTLERNFKHISESSFQTISESLPSMMNGLRMVWVISRHYNTDERMAPLMEMIAETFVRRIRDEVKLTDLLNMPFIKAFNLLSETREVLIQWSENYFKMRKRIEESGSDHRWEFDRKILFGKTDYMSKICDDLLEIINSIEHFKVFLGPELKSVTGDSAGIDLILRRVNDLCTSLKINNIDDKVFDRNFDETWDNSMKYFRKNVNDIQKLTEDFIKESFHKLRSAEGAFELVQNFQKIGASNNGKVSGSAPPKTSKSSMSSNTGLITQVISDRYNDILQQYIYELESIQKIFKTYCHRPMLYKNFPPIAGAIAWARDLYLRAKRPILGFKRHGGLLESPFGENVKKQYLEFARLIDKYINDLYSDWETNIASNASERLRQPVLKGTINSKIVSSTKYKSNTHNKQSSSSATMDLPQGPYRTNFPDDLTMIIKESKYLDKLGFQIPEGALNVTLQETKYKDIVKSLNLKLNEYDKVLASLKPVERQFLKKQIEELNVTLKAGFYPLNWTSQRIPAYIDDLNMALLKFSSIVNQVHKNSAMIDDILEKIANTQLVQIKDFFFDEPTTEANPRTIAGIKKKSNWQPYDISDFYESLEMNRRQRLQGLVDEYESIGKSFLLKLEEVVCGTNTGFASTLTTYYFYWEKCIYNAIVKMIISSIAAVLGMLQSKEGSIQSLFGINIALNGKDLIVSPSLIDIDKILTKAIRNIAESAKAFIRWMHGTCILTAPQKITNQSNGNTNDEEEIFHFTYYQDIEKNPEIVKLTLLLTSQTKNVYSSANKYLEGWKRYDKVNNLWNPKRKQQIEKIRPTNSNFDSAMKRYQSISETIESQPIIKDIEFLQINVSHLATSIAKQAELWKLDYGEALSLSSRELLRKLQTRFIALENQLFAETSTLEELKSVLNAIGNIQAIVQDVELEMMDIVERYRTLQRYNITVPMEELNEAMTIEKRWLQLLLDANEKNVALVDTKIQFRQVTATQDEDFRESLKELREDFVDHGPGSSSISLEDGVELLKEYKAKVADLNSKKTELINAQNLFGMNISPYPLLQQTIADIEQLSVVYDVYVQFRDMQENMSSMLWNDLDMTSVQKGLDDVEKLSKRFPSDIKQLPVYFLFEKKLVNFKEALPLVVLLKNDAMKQRHWQKLMDTTHVSFDVTLKTLTLSQIFSMELHNFTSIIEEIINEAIQENKIDNELLKIEATWSSYSLSVVKYKKDGQDRGFVLRSSEDLKLELEDNMLNLQTISGSRYVSIFVDRVRRWEKALNLVSEVLDIWYAVQRKWMYLEGIFIGAEDIRLQLPDEAKKFDAIDKQFKTIMTSVNKNPNVVDACTSENRLVVLKQLSERLDSSQKSLTDYLDTKRTAFPRFFFMSDDDLLSILGSSDPLSVQVHLLKLFDNVKELGFVRSNRIVDKMSSVEKEGFDLKQSVAIEGNVEVWLTSVEDEMRQSLHTITKEGVFSYASYDRTAWLKMVLGMVGLVGSQIWWTWEVEDTFRQVASGNKYAMKDLESKLTGQLNALVAMVRDKLDSITRKKVNTLLIIDVHARDIVDGFVRESILNAKEFAWESQLRFYWDKVLDDCVIRQCTGNFRYGYEYMGLNGRLVITPLTDRCYMTLTQALTFKLGGSPAGPAGTGKTETTKDLAKSLALPCFVINCGDGLDYKAMGSIFSGIVQVGAWVCCDEFNRINIEVLSVVSAQLRAIQNALLNDKPTCDIGLGRDMPIKRIDGFATCGFFITMNPGYAGRTELPDNLKALFRPVTMIVPDFLQICEIMLFSEGFEGAKFLAKKMTVLYKLSKEQLSKQYHYDFGLRALKSVLVMAGGLKRQYQDMSEDLVLMRCLRDSNMPKFIFEDVPLFKGLINDLFPGMDCPRVGYEDLKEAAAQYLEQHGFKCSNKIVFQDQIDKVVQMYETQLVRHTTMIVGPTGGGKSLILDTLKNARLISENINVKMYVLNPKAQPLKELYGEMDPVTRDWTDGILSKLFRELNEPLAPGKENEMRWIIYDGDVDALWVENMNSVMDDNRLLTLPNGERIRLQTHCAMICETFDLQYASPATISRCGMVWVDPQNLGYRPYYERWVRQRFGNGVTIEDNNIEIASFFISLFDKYIPKCVDMIISGIIDGEMGKKLQQVIPVSNIEMVNQLCSVIDAFLPFQESQEDTLDIESMYIFCIIWSLGASLLDQARIKFDAFIKKLARELLIPDNLTLYDYFYDLSGSHQWIKWQSKVPAYVQAVPFKFYDVVVPTTDSVLYTHLLEKLAPLRPILLCGESGTAKTTIVQKYLSTLSNSSFSRLNMNFSSRTTSNDVQVNIEANVDKRTGTIYGPPTGKKLIIFIDDLNMPKLDTYGTAQPIALLHYLLSRGALYDREKDLSLKTMKDLQYIAAMGPPGGGRNNVDPRFVSLFNAFNLTSPTQEILTNVYSSIINSKYDVSEFSDAIKGIVKKITPITLKLYNFMLDKMPPTPSKFHYIFNLRDISRIYEGLCTATAETINDEKAFLRLWRNECTRIFYDRLSTESDQQLFVNELKNLVKGDFGEFYDYTMKEPCLFGNFENAVSRLISGNASEDVQLYRDVGDYTSVSSIFQGVLDQYNLENKQMTLVLFEQALEHLCRILRIISCPRGNALLVGVGGSGKQSLTHLAAYCAGFKLFQISLSRGYGEEQFKEDLRELYKELGTREVVFLFTDAHVVEEGFLEFINNILTTGMVPALYDQDQKDILCNSVRQEVQQAGLPETPDNLWNFYVNKCRNNLHLVLSMSPSGSKLRLRCRNFPGLVSSCIIDWFFPWTQNALEKVAEYFLADFDLVEDEYRNEIVRQMVFTHQNITFAAIKFAEEMRRYYYVTPKNYLDFIANYRQQLIQNHKHINQTTKRLQGGLQKLIEASEAVDRMRVVLQEKKVIVDAKTADVQALIVEIQDKTKIASESREKASLKQKYAEEQARVITQQKKEADDSLAEAMPAVLAAAEALKNLDKNDLTELKAFANPPKAVKDLCMQLVVLRPTGEKLEENWNDAKKMLSNSDLLNKLKDFPKDKVTEKQIKRVKAIFQSSGEDLSLDKMNSISKAGYGLLTWVVAIVKYYEVAKNVEPLRRKVADMEKAQSQTEKELSELHYLLNQLSQELDTLNVQYTQANGELDVLQQEASIMTKRLTAASRLIEGLTGERTRWSSDITKLNIQCQYLIGDCLLGASFLSYMGAFTTDYRRELIYSKFLHDIMERGIPFSGKDFSLEGLLTTDAIVQGWVSKGLPADEHSIQNGILTTKGSRFPLCIDPQSQAVNWIKKTYGNKNLTVKKITDADFMKHLELAIQFGNPFLFENIDEDLDPLLEPILERNVVKQGGATMIKLGDKFIEWDDNFRLFFTTKLANPHFSPEIMGKTMIINYGVTMDGLANQLLNVVVGNERPDLEKQWYDLVLEMSENAQLLVSLEDTLLRELSSSQGNILDNQELIATLDHTKTKAIEIQNKLAIAKQTKDDISIARFAYKPVAKRGSILYFAEAGLATINSMYEISLDSFLGVFKSSLINAKKDSNLDSRLRNMIDTLMRQIYDYTCIGIFERHKLMFSFQMTCMIMVGEDKLEHNVLDFFLKGDTSLDAVASSCPTNWLASSCWKDLLCLQTLDVEVFHEIVSSFKSQPLTWKTWYDLEAPETYPLPLDFSNKTSPLQRLAIMRCFRPDRVYNAIKYFIMEILGEKFVQPPVLDFHRIYSQSSPQMPLVFILSPGADPQSDIQKFCDEMQMTSRFKFVALGQGQGPIAESLLESGVKRGHWILLQNCHLLASWLKVLEKILNEMKETHKDFRLWLTTEPTDKFPLGILQRSLKIVTEPPDGLKLNMRATYAKIDNNLLEACPHWAFRPCLYVLAFLHAVVLERRKYGKIGWNVNYDFNESDFNISRNLLSLYLQKSHEDDDEYLPWGSLKYLIGDAMYGGRVSDDMDRRILKTYLEEYMGDFLFDDCQKFSFSKVGFDYILPDHGEIEVYSQMIESLPLTNSPAVFGLNGNAEIGYYTNAVKAMWMDLISLQPRRLTLGEGISREEYIANTAKDIYSKIPLTSIDIGTYDLLQVRTILLRRNSTNTSLLMNDIPIVTPCQVVLLQELERWNNLVKKMASSLIDLQRALVGEIGMSDELDALGDSLFNGFLPHMWRKLAPDTQKPLSSWILHFSKRYQQYETWIHQGEPIIMWLSGLHIPESYLTALVQTTCRMRSWPLDKSTLYTVVTKYQDHIEDTKQLERLESGCYISGLYLEGAAWDMERSCLRLQDPKVLVVELPIMQIIPIEASKLKLINTFRTPVYVTQGRRNAMGVGLVFEADLASLDHASHWVLQGVALSLNTDA